MTTTYVLIGLVTSSVLMSLVSCVMMFVLFFREEKFQRLSEKHIESQKENLDFAKDVISTLKDVTHTMDAVIRSVEGSATLTKEKQNEIIEVLRQSEGRVMHAIDKIERLVTQSAQEVNFNAQTNAQFGNKNTQ